MGLEQEFLAVVKQGALDKVKESLDHHPELIDAKDEKGVSAVTWSAYMGQKAVTDYLISRGVRLDFFEAATLGKLDVLEQCLKEDPSLAKAYSKDGFSGLGLAAFFGHVEALQLLLRAGGDPNAASKNKMRVTPLHSAVAHRDGTKAAEMTSLLLAQNANVNVAQDGGWTPLHQAAAHGQTEILTMLLQRNADVNAQSEDGRLPVDMAAEKGHKEAVEVLRAAAKR
jgi:uncharacterized protein